MMLENQSRVTPAFHINNNPGNQENRSAVTIRKRQLIPDRVFYKNMIDNQRYKYCNKQN